MPDYKKEYDDMAVKATAMAKVLQKIEGRLVKMPALVSKVEASITPQIRQQNIKLLLDEISNALLDIRGDDEL